MRRKHHMLASAALGSMASENERRRNGDSFWDPVQDSSAKIFILEKSKVVEEASRAIWITV